MPKVARLALLAVGQAALALVGSLVHPAAADPAPPDASAGTRAVPDHPAPSPDAAAAEALLQGRRTSIDKLIAGEAAPYYFASPAAAPVEAPPAREQPAR